MLNFYSYYKRIYKINLIATLKFKLTTLNLF